MPVTALDVMRPGHEGPERRRAALGGAGDRWQGLRTLTRVRLLVASLALPIGVLFRPEAGEAAWWVLGWALLAVGLLSVLFWLGVRLKRGLGARLKETHQRMEVFLGLSVHIFLSAQLEY